MEITSLHPEELACWSDPGGREDSVVKSYAYWGSSSALDKLDPDTCETLQTQRSRSWRGFSREDAAQGLVGHTACTEQEPAQLEAMSSQPAQQEPMTDLELKRFGER